MVVTTSGEVAKSSGKKWLRFNMMNGYVFKKSIGRTAAALGSQVYINVDGCSDDDRFGRSCSICSLNSINNRWLLAHYCEPHTFHFLLKYVHLKTYRAGGSDVVPSQRWLKREVQKEWHHFEF